jgi:hypothetical protein
MLILKPGIAQQNGTKRYLDKRENKEKYDIIYASHM